MCADIVGARPMPTIRAGEGLPLERVDRLSVEPGFPVDMRPMRDARHADERDGLAARDMLADGYEHGARVVVAGLEAAGVSDRDAVPALVVERPTRLHDDAIVGRHD